MRWIVLLALLAAAPGAAAEVSIAPSEPPALDASERDELDTGGVVVRELPGSEGEGIAVLVVGLVEAPPGAVWAVMADCEEQDEFLPRISHAAVRDRDGDQHTCDLVVDLPFPFEDAKAATRHRVRRLPDGGYQRSWRLAAGDWSYERHDGSWTVHPYAGGRALLVNRMHLQPKTVLPLWFVRTAQAQQAPASFDAIRARVREQLESGPE